MNEPKTPFFVFDRGKHFIYLHEAMDFGTSVSRLALVSGWDSRCIAYDSAGIAWGFRFDNAKVKYSWLDKVFVQFYNPVRPASITWHQHRTYPLSDLQTAYLDALAH